MALSIPQKRSCYGSTQQYLAVWSSLVLALKSTEEVNNLAEYRYRDNLVEQVGQTTLPEPNPCRICQKCERFICRVGVLGTVISLEGMRNAVPPNLLGRRRWSLTTGSHTQAILRPSVWLLEQVPQNTGKCPRCWQRFDPYSWTKCDAAVIPLGLNFWSRPKHKPFLIDRERTEGCRSLCYQVKEPRRPGSGPAAGCMCPHRDLHFNR